MVDQIELLLRLSPQNGPKCGNVSVSDLETSEVLPLRPLVFVLTLRREPDLTFARGQLRTADGNSYPIQTNAALFGALRRYVGAGSRT